MYQESRTAAHIAYALMAIALFSGFPLLISALLAWLNRRYSEDPLLFCHYSWIIRTFWWSLLWFVLGSGLIATIILSPIGYIMLGLSWIWLIYRIIRGWGALMGNRNVY